ncbi:MAG: hypothetical protein D6720_12140 [Gammaproteobacteria bacterium]|nr:MAG: hypothetical protein D6720_12140 [Gammaproteobacteria bacterium]
MIIADWQDEGHYGQMEALDGSAWAWEFLRRNPGYQREWQAFMETWHALEADYGRPPHRDFCAWKNDPRAWVRAEDAAAGDCRVDEDKVLIECAFGARWGFHKFPPDPADGEAAQEGRISWRRREAPSRRIPVEEAADTDPLRQALLRFDLDLPLREQFEQAKRELQVLQRRRQREDGLAMRSIRNLAPRLVREVRMLDALAAEVPDAIVDRLGGQALVEAANWRCREGYLALPWLPR